MKIKQLSCFANESMKGKEIGAKAARGPLSVVSGKGYAEIGSHKPWITDHGQLFNDPMNR